MSISASQEHSHLEGHCIIQDLCSAVETIREENEGKKGILGVLRKDNKRYKLCINEERSTYGRDIVQLAEIIQQNNPTLSTKRRMQMAFQLCSMVLQLCNTPWVDDSWTWEESCAIRVVEQEERDDEDIGLEKEFCHLYVTQKFYSAQLVPENGRKRSRPETALSLIAGEPVLVKLGFALIVLAFGKTLQEIRDENPPDWLGSDSRVHNVNFLDLMTARKLVKSGYVRDEFGREYAEVVKACIDHQYHDHQSAGFKCFSLKDKTFLDAAEEAIVKPLYDHCKRFE